MKNSETSNNRDNATGGGAGAIENNESLSGLPAVPETLWIDRYWKIAILAGLFTVLFFQEIKSLVMSWTIPSESHGMLIPAFSLYFIYHERERLAKAVGKRNFLGLLIMIFSLVGYLLSINYQVGYPKQVMMIFMIAGVTLFVGGWPIMRLVWLPIFFLLFAIPLPAGLHTQITMPLRNLSSLVASMCLNLLPGIVSDSSNVLIHGTHNGVEFHLNVADACSGMRLLRAFVALGVAMAYLEYRPAIHRIVLLISTVPIAVFCNMLRVFLTGVVHIYIGAEYAQGTLHTLMGMVMLGVAFGLYGLLAWIMNNLYVDDDDESENGDADVLVINKA